jgi:hypothetical protein
VAVVADQRSYRDGGCLGAIFQIVSCCLFLQEIKVDLQLQDSFYQVRSKLEVNL